MLSFFQRTFPQQELTTPTVDTRKPNMSKVGLKIMGGSLNELSIL